MQIDFLKATEKVIEIFVTSAFVMFILLLPRYTDYSKFFFYLLCLTSLAALVSSFKEYSSITLLEKIFLFILVLNFAWISFCYYFNGEPGRGSSMVWDRHSYFLMLIPLFFLFRRYQVQADIFLIALFVSVSVAMVDIMIDIYSGIDYRDKGMNPNAFGPIQLCLAGIFLFTFLFSSIKWQRVISSLGFIIAVGTVILCKSRGVWLAIPFLGLFFVLYLGNNWSLFKKLIALGLIASICASLYFIPFVKDRVDSGISQTRDYLVTENFDAAVYANSPAWRLQLWEAAWKIFLDKPVTGIGIGGYQPAITEFETHSPIHVLQHPHNQYLNALATRGIPGFLLLLAILIIPIAIARERERIDYSVRISSASLIFISITFAIGNLTADHFEQQPTIMFYVALMAFLLGRRPKAINVNRQD